MDHGAAGLGRKDHRHHSGRSLCSRQHHQRPTGRGAGHLLRASLVKELEAATGSDRFIAGLDHVSLACHHLCQEYGTGPAGLDELAQGIGDLCLHPAVPVDHHDLAHPAVHPPGRFVGPSHESDLVLQRHGLR